ncbi:MAG: HAD-IIIA family hydrolase [Ferruginibacter sp.]
MLPLNKINQEWTLFLDRDGVINHEARDSYINTWDEFKFYENVPEALAILAEKFSRINMVTNQRGVGKVIMKESDLHDIHHNMLAEILKQKGRVDSIYYCTDINDDSPRRKPNPGMGLQATLDFPEIDLSRSLIVGNRLTDMAFGRNLGIHTVFLTTTHPETDPAHQSIDAVFPTLHAFALALP